MRQNGILNYSGYFVICRHVFSFPLALNAYYECGFIYARLHYKREACKWTSGGDNWDFPENQRWVKDPTPE